MDVPFRENGSFRFDRFRLDPLRRTLLCGEERIALQGRAFDTLAYLVANADRVVTRAELFEAVWPGRVVDENNLGQAISALRRSLRDQAGEALILTVAGRGYRIGVPVAFEPYELPNAGSVGFLAPEQPEAAPVARRVARHWVLAPLVACAVLAGVAWWALQRRDAAPTLKPPSDSIAVLAFSNLTGDPGQDYLSDGISEELTDRLGRIGGPHVAARRSTFSFKGGAATIADIARRLNVGAVLDGSVRRAGNRMRVTAQLIDAVSGYQIWSDSYDQPQGDALAIETALADAVVRKMNIKLSGADGMQLTLGGTKNPAALDAYLHARKIGLTGTIATVKVALADYETAIGLDPNYAMAHLGRSEALSTLVERQAERDDSWIEKTAAEAEAEIRRAIAIAPDLGVAHAYLADTLAEDHLDFVGALAEASRARMLAPGDAPGLMMVAFVQATAGHTQDAIVTAKSAASLDPVSARTYRWLASILIKARDFAGAEAALRHAQQIEPAAVSNDHYLAAVINYGLGRYAEVVRVAAGIDDWGRSQYLAMAYHALGRDKDAENAMNELRAALGDTGGLQYAEVYAQWGRAEEALAALKTAARTHDPGLVILKIDFLLDPIANYDGFKDIVRQLNFPA